MESSKNLNVWGELRSQFHGFSLCFNSPVSLDKLRTQMCQQRQKTKPKRKQTTKTTTAKLSFLPEGTGRGKLVGKYPFYCNQTSRIQLWLHTHPFIITAKLVVMRHTGSCPRWSIGESGKTLTGSRCTEVTPPHSSQGCMGSSNKPSRFLPAKLWPLLCSEEQMPQAWRMLSGKPGLQPYLAGVRYLCSPEWPRRSQTEDLTKIQNVRM